LTKNSRRGSYCGTILISHNIYIIFRCIHP
jgi:hypothetical protein